MPLFYASNSETGETDGFASEEVFPLRRHSTKVATWQNIGDFSFSILTELEKMDWNTIGEWFTLKLTRAVDPATPLFNELFSFISTRGQELNMTIYEVSQLLDHILDLEDPRAGVHMLLYRDGKGKLHALDRKF